MSNKKVELLEIATCDSTLFVDSNEDQIILTIDGSWDNTWQQISLNKSEIKLLIKCLKKLVKENE